MIQNARQYREARQQLSKWTALKSRLSKLAVAFSIDERELMELIDRRLNHISQSLSDFQTLQRTDLEDTDSLQHVVKLPASLIKARIALGWTQTELAKRTGLKVQHVHRYEKNSYSSIKLSRAIEIAVLLQTALAERATELHELQNIVAGKGESPTR